MNKPDRQVRSVISRLLDNIGSEKEIQQYLRRYSDLDANQFAVIKIGGSTLQTDLDELTSALIFLQQVGLTPIVVHGAGPQLNAALAERGIDSEIRDGLRVTSPAVLNTARQVFMRENLALVKALRDAGTNAVSITSGVFETELLDRGKYGMVGKINKVHPELLRHSLEGHVLPVLSPLGETADGQIVNVNADVATQALVRTVKPLKIVFLTGTGGILNADGRIIPSINLVTEYERLISQDWLHSGMRLKIEQINDLLRDLPPTSSVSITRPALLARELFTHRGSGTFVRLGERLEAHQDWDTVDVPKLRELVESSFGRRLVDDYMEQTRLTAAYISDCYRAAAIIVRGGPVPRLDKFVVTDKARGEGLGSALWRRLRTEHPQLFWRARPDNPINRFYFEHSDGCIKGEQWNVYWYGLKDMGAIGRCVDHAMAAGETLQ
ncbi:MAG: acetylglutamate kinase [Gammaproteobacteria bacterium]|nr:acetylglutamate kinase [Gammaproteobacteria bacterium]NNF60931.1 acetylglutamate kinase [Gammaproteobacteria bacterium]NNM20852.1 acetylglutamate kinase [Gammaproteobacteria bacterium]